MQRKYAGNMPYYTFEELSKPPLDFVRFAVSTREGGVSCGKALGTLNLGSKTKDSKENIQENYKRFCSSLGFEAKNVVLGNQTHSSNVRVATMKDAGKGVFCERDYEDVDALITNTPNLPLAIHTADCVPVTLIDPKNKAIGNAHCGWRGTFSCLAEITLREMNKEFGT
ncbi:MAG: laccase domain-containing protein, partial [Clostridia bacterium]|nr:laccase domain-containing protein [Clostridia bacterium]